MTGIVSPSLLVRSDVTLTIAWVGFSAAGEYIPAITPTLPLTLPLLQLPLPLLQLPLVVKSLLCNETLINLWRPSRDRSILLTSSSSLLDSSRKISCRVRLNEKVGHFVGAQVLVGSGHQHVAMLSCYHVGEMPLPAVAAVAEAAAAAAPAAAVSAKIDTAMPVATDFVPTGVADTVAGKRADAAAAAAAAAAAVAAAAVADAAVVAAVAAAATFGL